MDPNKDFAQKKREVQEVEKQFINDTSYVMEHKYKPLLFEKYKRVISNIRDCYADKNKNFDESESCAEKWYKKYDNVEFHYGRMIKKLEEGIILCTKTCANEFFFEVKTILSNIYIH